MCLRGGSESWQITMRLPDLQIICVFVTNLLYRSMYANATAEIESRKPGHVSILFAFTVINKIHIIMQIVR